jgi:hypothetical protein
MQVGAGASNFGFSFGNAGETRNLNSYRLLQPPVLNNHEKVLFPTLVVTLGQILSPLKGVIRL